jgi:hypothetical protein
MNRSPLLLLLFVLIALLLAAAPAEAGIGAWLSGFATRSRVIQICIFVMCLALFVMMKKFTDR